VIIQYNINEKCLYYISRRAKRRLLTSLKNLTKKEQSIVGWLEGGAGRGLTNYDYNKYYGKSEMLSIKSIIAQIMLNAASYRGKNLRKKKRINYENIL